MESIEVGEYVRTKDGYIAKITEIDHHIWFDSIINKISGISRYSLSEEEYRNLVIKHSKNIMDLVQEGDYIDGLRVEKNKYGELYTSYVYYGGDIGKQCEVYTEWIDDLKNENIDSVLTKEQFSKMEYIV